MLGGSTNFILGLQFHSFICHFYDNRGGGSMGHPLVQKKGEILKEKKRGKMEFWKITNTREKKHIWRKNLKRQ